MLLIRSSLNVQRLIISFPLSFSMHSLNLCLIPGTALLPILPELLVVGLVVVIGWYLGAGHRKTPFLALIYCLEGRRLILYSVSDFLFQVVSILEEI